MKLSAPVKEAIKTGLAMVLVYAVAMKMGWDKPYWAGFTVVTVAVLSSGVALSRGILRSLGTLVGAAGAVVILSLFPQDRWWLVVFDSLLIGFLTYMFTGPNQSYFWFLAALTCLIIVAVNSPPDAETAFNLAVTRTTETAMGAVVYALVAFFLWPRSSVGAFSAVVGKLAATQLRLYRAYRGLMLGEGTAEDSRSLRMQESELVNQAKMLLGAAETDSREVWEARSPWQRFHQQSTALMERLERWRQSFAEIRPLSLNKVLPGLEAACTELDNRFEEIQRLLAGGAPGRTPQPIGLEIDRGEMGGLARFEEAAVVVFRAQLETIERLSRSLLNCVSDIRGYPRQAEEPVWPAASRRGRGIDPDRVKAVFQVVLTCWIAFFLWVYANPPGGPLFVMMATIFALIMAMVPQASPSMLLMSWGGGGAFAGVLYLFVLPHLSGFGELAILIFVSFFAMHYLLRKPDQTVARMFVMSSFLVLVSIDNQQSYSFAQYANSMAWIMLSIALAAVTNYLPASPRPEKVFLRLLRRFFRHAEFLMRRLAVDNNAQRGPATRWHMALCQDNLLEIPGKLAAVGRRIDYRLLSGQTPEQVQMLAAGLQAVAYRIKDLADTRKLPQSDLLLAAVFEDLRDWQLTVQGYLRLWADDPSLAGSQDAEMRDRLAERMSRLEEHMREKSRGAQKESVSEKELNNFYRVLGAFRGLSESGIEYSGIAGGIDWAHWQEERF